MPEMDGIEATRRILDEGEPGRGPRVVALTAGVSIEDRRACREAGMEGFLSKPVHLDRLRQVLVETPSRAVAEGADRADRRDVQRDLHERLAAIVPGHAPEDAAFVRELLHDFLAGAQQALESLRDSVRRRDAESVLRRAHALGGTARNIGAGRLAEHASRCMRAARRGDVDAARDELTAIEHAFATIRDVIEADLEGSPSTAPDARR